MDDVKDKMKTLMKKVNNPFSSSSSSSFKGQGKVLGSSVNSPNPHPSRLVPPNPTPKRPNPIPPAAPNPRRSEIAMRVGEFLAAGPDEAAVEVVRKLLGNLAKDPGNEKFRRIRMGNPKIREAIGDGKGGLEVFECVGFRVGEEGGEIWAAMEKPNEEQIGLIREALSLLERWRSEDPEEEATTQSEVEERQIERKKIDRQVRVFFAVPESVAARIDLPDSFYNLSAEEVRREAELRKKKLQESQLLVPKSFREKQALAARKRYKQAIIRIQFPDGVVLQALFLPWEPTAVLYEFVSSALKEPSLEFDLLHPALPKVRLVPRHPRAGGRIPTLEEEDLVPSALLRFKPLETDSVPFTGLANGLLEIIEPLTSATTTL
ncbi:plant UBX domain-containing protein 2 [Typha angustifolia]|uniref:plant UBX domain-containing protein 2 n=1 Tax=Typha angustifolia TaxID=59011 RepID=UPI003C2E3CE2